MKRFLIFGGFFLCLLAGCQRRLDLPVYRDEQPPSPPTVSAPGFLSYTIKKGAHYAEESNYKPVDLSELRFLVRFDSSAIYKTISPDNQWDINKLYGFSDNNSDHHQYSARFGWNWRDGALRLYAYVYNRGERSSRELSTLAIGHEAACSIRIKDSAYVFTVDSLTATMPRLSKEAKAKGYQLYPYFGGDEPSPHDIRIWIKNL